MHSNDVGRCCDVYVCICLCMYVCFCAMISITNHIICWLHKCTDHHRKLWEIIIDFNLLSFFFHRLSKLNGHTHVSDANNLMLGPVHPSWCDPFSQTRNSFILRRYISRSFTLLFTYPVAISRVSKVYSLMFDDNYDEFVCVAPQKRQLASLQKGIRKTTHQYTFAVRNVSKKIYLCQI
jgi:hypothetical protein